MDLRKVLTEAKGLLFKLNTRISNLQDSTWIKDQIERTTVKRDRQEIMVTTIEDACVKLGLKVVVEPEFPGVPQNPREPREQPVAGGVHVLPPNPMGALPPGPVGALPPPDETCPHEWERVDDDWQRCKLCDLMDGIPCRVVGEARTEADAETVTCPACGQSLEAWEGSTHPDHTGTYHLSCAPWLQEEPPWSATPEQLAQPDEERPRRGRPRKLAPAPAEA